MASQGPNYPSSASQDTSNPGTPDTTWNSGSLTSIEAADGSCALSPSTGANTGAIHSKSCYILGKSYGFSIPATATINGIVVEIGRFNGNTGTLKDFSLRLTKDGSTYVGSDKADTSTTWPFTNTTATYGSSSDLWGTTWSPSDVNASTFGVAFAVNGNISSFWFAEVDFIRVTVYYTDGPPLQRPSQQFWDAPGHASSDVYSKDNSWWQRQPHLMLGGGNAGNIPAAVPTLQQWEVQKPDFPYWERQRYAPISGGGGGGGGGGTGVPLPPRPLQVWELAPHTSDAWWRRASNVATLAGGGGGGGGGPTLVQNHSTASSGSSASDTWPSATTTGNHLIAVVFGAGSTGTTITPPSGWTLAVRGNANVGGAFNWEAIYYIENAASRSGTETFTLSVAQQEAVYLFEYSGVAASSSLDQTASNSGNSSTPDSGTTAATSQAVELCVAGFNQGGSSSTPLSSPTNGFAIIDQHDISFFTTGVSTFVTSSAGTQDTGVTSGSGGWGGVIATFKAASSGGSVSTRQPSQQQSPAIDHFDYWQQRRLIPQTSGSYGPVVFRASNSGSNGTGTSCVVTLPTVVAGDTIVIAIGSGNGFATPSGYTLAGSATDSSASVMQCFVKSTLATGSETTVTFTGLGGSDSFAYVAMTFYNSSGLWDGPSTASGHTLGSITCSGIVLPQSGEMLIAMGNSIQGGSGGGVSWSGTSLSSPTIAGSPTYASATGDVLVEYQSQPSSGTTSSISFGSGATSHEMAAVSIALRTLAPTVDNPPTFQPKQQLWAPLPQFDDYWQPRFVGPKNFIVGAPTQLALVGPTQSNAWECDYYNPTLSNSGVVSTKTRVHDEAIFISASSQAKFLAIGFKNKDGVVSSVPSGQKIYGRFYFQPSTLPGSTASIFSIGKDVASTWTPGFEIKISSGGILSVYANGSLVATGSTALSTGTWYRINFSCIAETGGAYTLKINGTTELSGTTGTLNTAEAAFFGNFTAATIASYYCDAVFTTGVEPGNGACRNLLPTADVSTGSWVSSSGGTLWHVIGAYPWPGSPWITTTTNGDSFLVSTAGSVPAGAQINGVKIIGWFQDPNGDGTTSLSILGTSSGVTRTGPAISGVFLGKGIWFPMGNDPNGDAPWTTSNLNSLQIGAKMVSGATNTSKLSFLYLVVDYDPPPDPPPTHQPDQRWWELPHFNNMWWEQFRLQPVPQTFLPTPFPQQHSQRIDPLPDYWQEWSNYAPAPIAALLYVPPVPEPPPTQQPSQRFDPLPVFNDIWWRQRYVWPIPQGTNLFVNQQARQASKRFDPLYDWWLESPAYIQGPHKMLPRTMGFIHQGLPLFLNAAGFNKTKGLTLYVVGTTYPGLSKGLPLVTYSGPSGNVKTAGMPLFINAPSAMRLPSNMNLVMTGGKYSGAKSLTLFLQNNNAGTSGGIPLLIFSQSGVDGAIPYDGGMNLFLKRPPENAIPLYLHGPGVPTFAAIPLCIIPSQGKTGGVTLAMPKTIGLDDKGLKLFIRGF